MMLPLSFLAVLVTCALSVSTVTGFMSSPSGLRSQSQLRAAATAPENELPAIPTDSVVSKVAVAGATGKTGRYVVKELLERGVSVVALARDLKKAKEIFGTKEYDDARSKFLLAIRQCDLTDTQQINDSVEGCDAAVWCAAGFAGGNNENAVVQGIKKLFGIEEEPKVAIDTIAIPAMAKAILKAQNDSKNDINGSGDSSATPKFVMMSSAGVTRPSWDAEKKEQLKGSSDIPIVRLNPFGVLDIKAACEEKLRKSGVLYSIVRPAGLNDKWPAGSRPIFTQGDVAVGRICRKDAAMVLVDALSSPEATGKTFECITAADYPPANSVRTALSRLALDADGGPSPEQIATTYAIMQQLLPGERQNSAALAMGQTYEQLDKNQQGRLGKRGSEPAERAFQEA